MVMRGGNNSRVVRGKPNQDHDFLTIPTSPTSCSFSRTNKGAWSEDGSSSSSRRGEANKTHIKNAYWKSENAMMISGSGAGP